MGAAYKGKIAVTRSGALCQPWTSNTPTRSPITQDPANFPDSTVAEAASYCRNPGSVHAEGPWCYTLDPNNVHEYCNIPYCAGRHVLFYHTVGYKTRREFCNIGLCLGRFIMFTILWALILAGSVRILSFI